MKTLDFFWRRNAWITSRCGFSILKEPMRFPTGWHGCSVNPVIKEHRPEEEDRQLERLQRLPVTSLVTSLQLSLSFLVITWLFFQMDLNGH
ncbi:MAG: hypothetical protein JXL84_26320, partial [Deltaproteobacteria bacterium]|nr:hypothetical protein [Deltaproteobacteria bacterium]